jgi:hypothetical protein
VTSSSPVRGCSGEPCPARLSPVRGTGRPDHGPSEAEGEGGWKGWHDISSAFLILILVQAVHSVEEYLFRLYDVLAPARYVSGLFGVPPPLGFIISNSLLVLLGLWCWIALIRPQRSSARVVAWLGALGEIANGLGHIALALAAGGYFPGLATTPLLLAAGAWLVMSLRRIPPRHGDDRT